MIDIESRVSRLETKFELFMDEMRDFKAEMREQNKMRADEIRELRQKQETEIREMQKKIDSKFDKLNFQLQIITVAAVVGAGAIVWAVVSVVR